MASGDKRRSGITPERFFRMKTPDHMPNGSAQLETRQLIRACHDRLVARRYRAHHLLCSLLLNAIYCTKRSRYTAARSRTVTIDIALSAAENASHPASVILKSYSTSKHSLKSDISCFYISFQ